MNIRLKDDSIIRRKSIFAVIPLLSLLLVFSLTTAYFRSDFTTTNEIVGTGAYVTVRDQFTAPSAWQPGEVINTSFGITNNEDFSGTTVAVRARVIESWKDSSNNVLSNTYNSQDVVVKSVGSNWTKNGDYYYYNNQLAVNQETTTLFNSLTLNPNVSTSVTCVETNGVDECTGNGSYLDATYTMTIEYQFVAYSSVVEAWGFDPTSS